VKQAILEQADPGIVIRRLPKPPPNLKKQSNAEKQVTSGVDTGLATSSTVPDQPKHTQTTGERRQHKENTRIKQQEATRSASVRTILEASRRRTTGKAQENCSSGSKAQENS
jgi:hypothetical protein